MIVNKKADVDFDEIIKFILWAVVFVLIATGLYFLIKSLTKS